MKTTITRTAAVLASASLMGAAHAGSAIVDGLGGPLLMESKFIEGVFGEGSPNFSGDALRTVHADLHSSGIGTEGFVTMLLADTDHGLTWMVLVDDNTQEGNGNAARSELGMSSTAPDTGVEFINDNSEDILHLFDPPNGTQTAAGHFNWRHEGRGDGFAWAELSRGDFVSFNFTRGGPNHDSFPGLNSEDTFQFVSWNGEGWEVVATQVFSQADQFAYSFTIIPLPAPVAIGLVGLGMVCLVRRRMKRHIA